MPLVVALVFASLAVVAWSTTRDLVRSQEQRLLAQKSAEVGALLRNAFTGGETSLSMLNAIATAGPPELIAATYEHAARPLIRNSTLTVATVFERSDGFGVVASVGQGAAPGALVSAERAALAARALTKETLAFRIIDVGEKQHFVFAVPAADKSRVVTLSESLLDAATPAKQPKGSPFAELRFALYASGEGQRDVLLTTTEKRLPLAGHTVRSTLPIGADKFVVVLSAKEPLVGGVATRLPMLRLFGGLAAAALATGIAVSLTRRRDYALQLVAKRTAELTASLDELAETRTFLERMLTAGPLVVLRREMSTMEVTYVSPNVERLFGYSDVTARDAAFLADHAHPEDLPAGLEAFDEVMSGRTAQAVLEMRVRNAADQYRWIAAQLVPEFDEDGRVVAVITYCIDVDDRHRAEDAQREAQQVAEAASQAKSAFLSHMSHELRTPLNAVLGFGQVLEYEEITDSQREAVGHILQGGRHLLGLINEVLDITRIETGDLPLSPEVVDPAEIVHESIDLIRPIATQRGVALHVEDVAVDGAIYADRQRVKQVLLNLLSNAVKYNRADGQVAVAVRAGSDERIAISVRDTGPGIAAESFPKLFVPFERLGADGSDVEGTGIGLTLAQQLAHAMGGAIEVTSVVGEGSTFTVEFPAVLPQPAQGQGEPPADEVAVQTRQVLHIEDSLANLKLVERILARHGEFNVIPAMTGSLGIELAREHHPMLVLLDLDLPDISGELVLRRLRSEPATAAIPVVVLSADATPEQGRRLLAAGASAYLTKPVDVPELLRALDEAVPQRGLVPSTSP